MITGSGKPLLFANGEAESARHSGEIKEAQISQEHTAKERATLGRPSTRNRPKKQAARAKGDDARVDAINRQQLKVARDALRAYKE